MTQKMPNTPFSTRLSGSSRELELRLRSIFRWKKKRPPVVLLALAAAVALLCGSLIGFSAAPRNGTLGEVYQAYFTDDPTSRIGYENKEAAYPSLTPDSDGFDDALEYICAMELRSVLGHKGYIGDFDNRDGAVVLTSEAGEELWIDLYRTGYVVISGKGAGRLDRGDDAGVFKVSENFDTEMFLSFLSAEPQEMADTGTVTPDVSAQMAAIRAEDIVDHELSNLGVCVTAQLLAEALNAAADDEISEERFLSYDCADTQIFPHWIVEAYLTQDTHSSADRHLSISCGLPENIVQVTLSEDRSSDTACFENQQLYWLVRGRDDYEDYMTGVDMAAYERFEELLVAQMEITLARLADNPGNFNGYELKRFLRLRGYENEDGSQVELYDFAFGLLTDTPETVGWSGGMALDSHLRVVNMGEPKYFAVKYRNGQVVGTAFLGADEIGTAGQDQERINAALDAAEDEPVPDGHEQVLRMATIDGLSHMPLEELPRDTLDALTLVSESDLSGVYNGEWGWIRAYTSPGLDVTTTAPSAAYLQYRRDCGDEVSAGEEGREWIIRATIRDGRYATQSGLTVGMTCAQARTLGYSLQEGDNTFGGGEAALTVTVENDTVTALEIVWLMGRYIGKYFEL